MMRSNRLTALWLTALLSGCATDGVRVDGPYAEQSFAELHKELRKKWPKNRLVRIVFHGHSVPAGYFATPVVKRFSAYPTLFHERLCEAFPTAVIDVCVTAIGGEHAEQGAARFEPDVLSLRPDLVFLDYALNDRRLGLKRASVAWRQMIRDCVTRNIPVVLLTATPDARSDLRDADSPLARHCQQIRDLATEFELPVVDSYARFRRLVEDGAKLESFLSQANHPNEQGHAVVADLAMRTFMKDAR